MQRADGNVESDPQKWTNCLYGGPFSELSIETAVCLQFYSRVGLIAVLLQGCRYDWARAFPNRPEFTRSQNSPLLLTVFQRVAVNLPCEPIQRCAVPTSARRALALFQL